MAKIVVTFGASQGTGAQYVPLELGERARTEEITVPGTGSLVATAAESVVSIYATADSYVTIGPAPDAGGVKRRFIPTGMEKQFSVSAGSKVRVIAASL